MASPQSLTKKPQTLTLDSSHLFHSSLRSLSSLSAPKLPLSFPPIPPDFPQCKIIPNTRFLVDAFRHSGDYSVAYFLSHFHSDHYTGLSATWSKGIVFCSDTTARLLIQVLKVPSPFVVALPLRKPALIDGSEVTLVDANHCPGAVQFLFRVPGVNGRFERYVHTGDFRFCDSMKSEPVLAEFVGSDAIFLDTTYCNPKFLFPSQEESIDYIVSVIERTAGEYAKGSLSNVLFIVATYVVGKEKILVEIARRCKRKVHVNARKFEVLRVLGYAESGVFTEDHTETDVHVVGWNVLGETWPYFRPNFVRMKEIMEERKCSKVVGFVPTGWTYEMKQNKFPVRTKDSFDIHLVPYSEHSNYEELREYVKFLKPKRVIPTVGSGIEKLDSKHVNKMQKYFAGLVDEIANKQEFLMGFHRGCGDIDNKVKEVDDSDQNEVLQAKETRLLDVKDPESRDAGFTLDCPSPLQELGEQDLTKVIEELRESLPTWVTRDQMLDLISSSGRNIVDAVSNFYDNETKFHEQAFSCSISCSTSQTNSRSDSVSFLKPDLLETSPFGSTDIPFSQKLKASNTKPLIKNIASPGKKKGSTASKPNKKAKLNSKLNSSGKGQTSITKFFNKVVPNASLDGRVESESDQYPKGKTTGDLNMALNLHYGNSAGDLEKNEKRLVVCANSDQPQCIVSNSMGDHVRTKKNLGHLANLSVQGLSSENVNATLVSLPSEKYNPIEHACWKSGQHAPYIHLARTFDLVEGERGKTKATSMMCNMFRSLLALSPEDVLPAVYLCTNKIAADHENMELNIGGSLVTAALEEACGMNRSKIRDMYNSLGDLGDVAQVCRQTQSLLAHPSPLLIKDVFSVLRKISVQTGSGSTARKKSLIVNLMRSCREMEMKFLVRTLVKNLRIGAMIRTVLPALAQAVVVNFSSNFHHEETAESLKEKLQRLSVAVVEAYNILPDLDLVVPSLLKEGIGFSSSTLSIVPGIPIKPMLAKITNGVPQALRLFQNKAFTCEYKYDGQRAQIHKLVDGSIRVFSRSGEEATARFPDVINIIKESCKPAAHTFILDSEVVAVDRKNGCKLMSFQELSSRERGSKDSIISVDSIKVDICVFIFDIMFANGEQLLGSPLRRRRQYFMDLFCNEKLGYFEYAKKITIEANDACLTNEATLTKMSSFLEDAFHSSCEGIIVKSLDVDAGYTPSKRSNTWLKVKRDYVEGLNDSVDLVPIGAWHGNGRKAGWYSPFLMACYNPETEEFQSVCRVMSGFSDSFYKEMKEFFCGDKILSKKPSYYRTAEGPDMWFSPEVVWEIRGADFTVSSVHQAAVGLVHPSRGISIRFPRFIRCVSDRNPEECSTAADMAEMFFSQTRRKDVMVED